MARGYVAADDDGKLAFFQSKPKWQDGMWVPDDVDDCLWITLDEKDTLAGRIQPGECKAASLTIRIDETDRK